jgi:ATP-dependent RNA helicase DeaD
MNFTEFTLSPELARAVARAGFKEASPIQEQAIPLILSGKDIVGQAHTGTGKTAAFALPTLHLMKGGKSGVETLVIVPTRELAVQVADEYYKFSRDLGIRTATVYGGTGYKRQIDHVANAGVVVATPGRLLDLLSQERITLSPRFVILDEADEMLNMGFIEDVRRILEFFPKREQTLLFSATLPAQIKDLAETIQKKPEFIRTESATVTKNSIEQYYYVVDEHERDEAIIRLIDFSNPKKSIIFCRTKKETTRVSEFLSGQGFKTEALHGDVDQWDRQRIIKSFRRNEFEILVATDVAARGLDIRDVSHVFNYHIPFESESYVHRIGRTGRADKTGIAMMLVTPHELDELKRIMKDMGSELTFATVPQRQRDPMEQVTHLAQLIADQKVGKDAGVLLKKVSQGFSPEVVAEKLLMLLADRLGQETLVGKSQEEALSMMNGRGDTDSSDSRRSSSSRGSSRNSSSRSSSRSGSSRSSSSSRDSSDSRRSSSSRGSSRDDGQSSSRDSSFSSRGSRTSGSKGERGNKKREVFEPFGEVPLPKVTPSGARIIARKME